MLRLLFAALLVAASMGCVWAAWYGTKHWWRWEGKAVAVIAALFLLLLFLGTAIIFVPVDIYIHDTYFIIWPW